MKRILTLLMLFNNEADYSALKWAIFLIEKVTFERKFGFICILLYIK
jgi:hypothetical protein